MTPIRPRLILALPLACLLSLPGCSLVGGATPPATRYFTLDYPMPKSGDQTIPAVLQIAAFSSAADYDRDEIVVREHPHQLARYYYRRWASSPTRMISDLLQRDLSASGLFRSVVRGALPLRADMTLTGTIETLEENTVDECFAQLRLRFTLIDNSPTEDAILYDGALSEREPCTAGDVDDIVGAMSRALERISGDLRQALAASIAAAPASTISGSPR